MARSASLDTLRAATHDVHQSLERHLSIGRADATGDDYRRWARAMYGWLAPFEQTLWAAEWPDAVEASSRDQKRRWLEADLTAMGDDVSTLPRIDWQPPLATQASRFGVAYVIEGSTLGGQVLHRALAPKIAPSEGLYLRGHGEKTGERWKAFTAALDASLTTEAEVNEAAQAARATFTALEGWLAKRGTARD